MLCSVASEEARGATLRERTRRAVQAEIASQAMSLFTVHGFEATTIDQIAAAAGISTRSFFRYFDTKEDVVIGDPLPAGRALQAALEARPAAEAPWVALRQAFDALIELIHADPARALRTSTIMLTTYSLRARHLEKQLLWERLLVPNVSERLGPDTDSRNLRAHAIVSSALACLDVALVEWALHEGTEPIENLLDTAISAVSRVETSAPPSRYPRG
jgi:AcrR family transcriptional regulator